MASTGINVPQGPLVTPATPVGQDAVNSMVDAFRKGQINSQDLVDHYGMKARAETQLGTAQAEAALPLVEPTAQLQQAKMASELAQTNWGQTSLKTAQETMGWFGDDINNYIDPTTGKTDFQKLAKVGAQRVATLGQVDKWAGMLKPVSSRVVKLGDGSEVVQYLNALNQDVTPPADGYDGSEQYWHYVTQLEAFMPKSHPLAGVYPTKYDASLRPYDPKNSSASAAGHPTGAVVPRVEDLKRGVVLPKATAYGAPEARPENPKLSEMRAALLNPDASNSTEVANMTPEQVVAASPMKDVAAAAAGPAVTPITPTPLPNVLPAPPQTPPKSKLVGIPIKAKEQTIFTAKDIRENLLKEKPYQDWQKTTSYATPFEKAAATVRSMTREQQQSTNMNLVDLGLAESLIKMYDPDGAIREFKWDKFEKNQPLLDRAKNWQSEFKRLGTFTPETRAEIVRMGTEVIEGREEAARPAIELALRQAASNPNVDLGTVFTSQDERVAAAKLADKKPVAQSAGSGFNLAGKQYFVKGLGVGTLNGNVFTPSKR